ncbi:hypothetical protein F2P56_026755 [Juglans regia]|uniref:RING-type domain-containing protein n=2 Tax=Juglans regia TaxID=51240 RepID=A0A833UH29_JUGRE|nr:RING-H2 finger protein ATL67-like isoform X1 [Juglans regia]KAF5451665.1 hypothetical protein F2P56_026755 [Juglans regia]
MSTPAPATSTNYLTNLGLGYAIAIALGFLVLLSALLLASYLCCRSHPSYDNHHHHNRSTNNNNLNPNDGIILPRIIFVAEDEDEDQSRDGNVAVGLDQSVINSYPKFPYYVKDDDGLGTSSTTCSICLCEYKDSEMLRMMPECRHYFHLYCIDHWLKLNGSCPVCRNSPLPTPLSTPLSEVVPLSQYAADRRRRWIASASQVLSSGVESIFQIMGFYVYISLFSYPISRTSPA